MAATLKDIAQEVGVSVTTVSRALTGYDDVAADTRQRIHEAAVRKGYSPNITAQRLQKQRTDMIGFIIPTFGPRFADPFFSEFIAGIGNEAAIHHYDLLVSTHAPNSKDEQQAYQKAVKRGWVDGLIVVRTRENDGRIRLLSEHDFPFVSFGRTNDELDFPYIDEDGAAGMKLLVQHFIDLGHKRIGLIASPKGLMFSHFRLQSFYETMRENGLPVQNEWVIEGDMTQRGGAAAVKALLEATPQPTSIIGGNDLMAIGAMNQLQQQGFQVGRDIVVGGFDDIPIAAYFNPPLTTVHQPIYEIGQRICAMLIDLINGRSPADTHILLTPTLIVRESSGSALANNQ